MSTEKNFTEKNRIEFNNEKPLIPRKVGMYKHCGRCGALGMNCNNCAPHLESMFLHLMSNKLITTHPIPLWPGLCIYCGRCGESLQLCVDCNAVGKKAAFQCFDENLNEKVKRGCTDISVDDNSDLNGSDDEEKNEEEILSRATKFLKKNNEMMEAIFDSDSDICVDDIELLKSMNPLLLEK